MPCKTRLKSDKSNSRSECRGIGPKLAPPIVKSRAPDNSDCVRKRRAIASTLLILFGIGLGVIVAEAAIRLFGFGKPDFYTYSATRGWKLRAGATGWQTDEGRAFIRLNRWGYRGADWTRVKPSGTLRIAVLGDSFVEAQQVAEQDTACEVIQRALTQMLPTSARGSYQSSASRGHEFRGGRLRHGAGILYPRRGCLAILPRHCGVGLLSRQ